MVSPDVPVPLITGRESSVAPPLIILPVISPTLSSTPVIASLLASGGVVSIPTVITVGWLGLPAASAAVTIISLFPSANGVVGVTDQLPWSSALVVRVSPLGRVTVTSAPGSVLPSMVGVGSLVMPSPLTPVSDAGSSHACGAAGPWVSTSTTNGSDIGLVLPATLVTVSVMSCGPSLRGLSAGAS